MSQISPPIRILLIAGVVFLAAWFTVLKPKPASVEPATTTTPPASGFGKAVDAAKKAAGQATGTTQTETEPKTGAATTTEQAPPAEAPPVTIPPEELAKLPKDVATALEEKKVLVLGVIGDEAEPWRPLADDDRYVRNTLDDINTYDGGVVVKQVEAGELSRYGALVNELSVLQTPSVVIIDANLQGRVLTGYVDRISINQVIADARDAGIEPDISDPYLRQLNSLCGDYNLRSNRWSRPTINGDKAQVEAVDRLTAIVRTYRTKFRRSDAPAKWNQLRKDQIAWLTHVDESLKLLRKAVKTDTRADALAYTKFFESKDWTTEDRRADDAGVTSCVSNRRT